LSVKRPDTVAKLTGSENLIESVLGEVAVTESTVGRVVSRAVTLPSYLENATAAVVFKPSTVRLYSLP
jgi:hypothetical protein